MGTLFKRRACATCTYWDGPREITPFNDGVKCDKANDPGTCRNPRSTFYGKDKKAEYGPCTKYEKWNAIPNLKV